MSNLAIRVTWLSEWPRAVRPLRAFTGTVRAARSESRPSHVRVRPGSGPIRSDSGRVLNVHVTSESRLRHGTSVSPSGARARAGLALGHCPSLRRRRHRRHRRRRRNKKPSVCARAFVCARARGPRACVRALCRLSGRKEAMPRAQSGVSSRSTGPACTRCITHSCTHTQAHTYNTLMRARAHTHVLSMASAGTRCITHGCYS